MYAKEFGQLALYLVVLLALAKPLGWYIARVYEQKPCGLDRLFGPLERLIYRAAGISPTREMTWKQYLFALLILNVFGLLALYSLLRFQAFLPLNPQSFPAVSPDLAFNTASSYVTNTNWQSYSGESSLSYLTQMMGMTVENFLSAACGLSVLVALVRGIVRHGADCLGNFWVDTLRGILYILLPLSIIFSLVLVSQGVIQNFKPYQSVNLLQPYYYPDSGGSLREISTQIIPMGPVASQVAIKQLGTNGGGFFNTNSAHPFENPNPISNFLEMIAILLIPASLCFSFGHMVGMRRQGTAILVAMLLIFIPFASLTMLAEHQNHPAYASLGIAPGGNMEGKEQRFGLASSALWATATTAASNGSVNAMHDSFTPLSLITPLMLMHLGEVVFGGVGSGLYGMLMLVILTVFVAGLMVGRTPEFMGKKIEPYEMKMVTVAVLIMPLMVLVSTAFSVLSPLGLNSIANPGAHGFIEILYAWTSMGTNNGSSMAGLNTNTVFYNTLGGLIMLFSRYWIAIPTLAIAGSLAKKKKIPSSLGTLPTHTPLFVLVLIVITLMLGALTFLSVFALGPIVEQLMWK
jgi:K+-transporting ATPase ATPase A chain